MTPNCNSRKITLKIIGSILLLVAFFSLIIPAQAHAQSASSNLPELSAFIATVRNGAADQLRGVYVPNVMMLPIVQQPEGDARFVSGQSSVVTEFDMAAKAGNVGLLAHNTLAGKFFFSIPQNSRIILVYGDGHTEIFVVEKVLSYQALSYGLYSNIQTGETVGVGELFSTVYEGERHLTLQTCIESDGNFEWGRMFIIAKPFTPVLVDISNLAVAQ